MALHRVVLPVSQRGHVFLILLKTPNNHPSLWPFLVDYWHLLTQKWMFLFIYDIHHEFALNWGICHWFNFNLPGDLSHLLFWYTLAHPGRHSCWVFWEDLVTAVVKRPANIFVLVRLLIIVSESRLSIIIESILLSVQVLPGFR